jgi:hypothetical protein
VPAASAATATGPNDRVFLHAAWAVLFHLGIIGVTPPNRRRREHAGHAHHFGGVPAWLAARFEDYTSAISGTHERSTMDGIAIRLAHSGRHLAAVDPDLESLAGLDRTSHRDLPGRDRVAHVRTPWGVGRLSGS